MQPTPIQQTKHSTTTINNSPTTKIQLVQQQTTKTNLHKTASYTQALQLAQQPLSINTSAFKTDQDHQQLPPHTHASNAEQR